MLQVFLRGGLGNQLFQYSTGLAIAQEQGRELVLRGDLLPIAEDTIGGVSRWPNQLTDFQHSGTIRTNSHQPGGKTNFFGKAMQVMRLAGDHIPNLLSRLGWLASEDTESSIESLRAPISLINSYSPFKDLAFRNREKLRSEISAVHEPSKEFLNLSSEIQESKAIAVHLRQGDYLSLGHIYGSSSLEFLQAAVKELKESGGFESIWLFTDTPSAVPEDLMDFLNPQKVIGPETLPRPLENLILMSKARALIAANSSFSWWSALLTAEGTPVYAPFILNARVNNFSKDSELDRNWRTLNVS